jgi:hypothetical protein
MTKDLKVAEKERDTAERPKLSKETLRDLDPKARGVDVKGGVPKSTDG